MVTLLKKYENIAIRKSTLNEEVSPTLDWHDYPNLTAVEKSLFAWWDKIVERNIPGPDARSGAERLSRYLGSLCLGRGFHQSVDDYLEERGLTRFCQWAMEKIADYNERGV